MNEGHWLLMLVVVGLGIMVGANFLPIPYSWFGILTGLILVFISVFILVDTDSGGCWA